MSEESRMRRDVLGVKVVEYGVMCLISSTVLERVVLAKETFEFCEAEAHAPEAAGVEVLSRLSGKAFGM